jgi:hypothetical protein
MFPKRRSLLPQWAAVAAATKISNRRILAIGRANGQNTAITIERIALTLPLALDPPVLEPQIAFLQFPK